MTDKFEVKPHEIGLHYLSDCGVPGTIALVATWSPIPSPIATVWYRLAARRDELEIVHSWVREAAQRQGIRSRLNTELFRGYPKCKRIVTQSGTESGLAFMRATGYKQHKSGYWYVTRAAWKRQQESCA